MERIYQRIDQVIETNRERFLAISRQIHANPELGFEEFKAQQWLTEPLAEAGFAVETGLAGIETSFRATYTGKADGPTIAVLCEYDALAGLGHACGHNLIGTGGMLAGWALRQAWPDLPGKIQVIGTPAEEGGGGKIIMVDQGVFEGVDAAMMFHPSGTENMVHRGGLACQELKITFHGKPAHAAAGPWNGLNALDAVIQTFVGIGLLRQQLRPDARLHGIITKGGDAINVIPELTECRILVRATAATYLKEIMERVRDCARAGALATGTTVEFAEGLFYANRINNMVMARGLQQHLEVQGLVIQEPDPKAGVGSSDIGNVSRVCPAIHPYIGMGHAAGGHTDAFRAAAVSPEGLESMLHAARGLAKLAADLLGKPEMLAAAKAEFAAAIAGGQ